MEQREKQAYKYFTKKCIKLGVITIICSLILAGLGIQVNSMFLKILNELIALFWGVIGVVLISKNCREDIWETYKEDFIERFYLDD